MLILCYNIIVHNLKYFISNNFEEASLMKKIVMCLISCIMVLLISISASASSYEYIIDNYNLFDDSSEMISMAKEIRSKLDFNIHIYSLDTTEDSYDIIEQYVQDSSVLLIFVPRIGPMDWYAGSTVQRTIKDVDLENIFAHVTIGKKQYTKAVNSILSKILAIYVYEEETIDKYEITTKHNNDSQFSMNLQHWLNIISQHPAEVLVCIFLLVVAIIYLIQKRFEKE